MAGIVQQRVHQEKHTQHHILMMIDSKRKWSPLPYRRSYTTVVVCGAVNTTVV